MNDSTGVVYWRSLEELTGTPEFEEAVRREFPNDEWDRLPPATRRQFLKVMGASLAFAGLTACRWPKEAIVPFAHRPEGRIPGVPQYFATSMQIGGTALGMVVTSFDGRPIKAEGNPEHPGSLGALSAIGQATVLGMYDPDRSRRVILRESGQEYVKTWDDVAAAMSEQGSGEGFAVLAEASSSPSLARLRDRLLAARPGATWYEYEPVSDDAEREGLRAALGRPMRLHPHLDRAKVIACFDADPLLEHPAAVRLARLFAASRDPHRAAGMSRLYVCEPRYTLTGGRADHRLAVPASEVPALLAALTSTVLDRLGRPTPPPGQLPERRGELVAALADDLLAHRGEGVVMVGRGQPPATHAMAALLNAALGNAGATVTYSELPDSDRPSHLEAISRLAARMREGSVQTLLILGGNPAYDAPSDLGFAELLERVPVAVHLSLYDDETSQRCRWHLPQAHHLEAWGDGLGWDGTVTLQQPLIEPLYGGRSAIEVLQTVLGPAPTRGYDIVRETVRGLAAGQDFESFWRRSLHDGLVAGTAAAESAPDPDAEAVHRLAAAAAGAAGSGEGLELVLAPDAKVYDGRFANNAWLQELPDTVTKLTWGNALQLSPATARDLGVVQGDLVAVTAAGTTVEVPIAVTPGVARSTAVLALGYGRRSAGRVGNGVGVDAYPLRTTAAPWVVPGAGVHPTGGHVILASTQDHHAIDSLGARERTRRSNLLVREANLDLYLADPEVFHHMDHHPPLVQLWEQPAPLENEQWAMAIDLNACTGCNACVVACQAENNIPVVGREQVINQREMHWIRIDRYFRSPSGVPPDEVDDAAMVVQPMACVHCENAPCEQVCPVAATVHTFDGLNAMVYNRCIGTRYCSNNCPFKVRRFNFFNYRNELPDVIKMQFNPDVTVRSRGVMEKCTYCTQRIERVRIQAKNERRPIRDGEIVPACAQTCPAQAIHFGNLNDPASEISRLRDDHRAYATLVELNVRPRTSYLGRLQNPAGGGEAAPAPAHHGPADDHGKGAA